MKIIWYGQSCFKIITKNAVIVTNPFGKETGLKPPRFEADIVTFSDSDYSHKDTTIKGEFFEIDGPGEYEIKQTYILGIDSAHISKDETTNTIYVIKSEGIKICHLGNFKQNILTDDQLEKIGDVGILMIPVGGASTINGEQAVKIINQIEPKIVIPMHYKIAGLKEKLQGIESFLREIGEDKANEYEQLTVKKDDMLKEKMEVIVMKTK